MSANLFGAMCGGLLEYNSMYFGFQFLYLMAAGLYLLAFVWELAGARSARGAREPLPAAATAAGR
jgi:predicted MFS family arabinose efflux permease